SSQEAGFDAVAIGGRDCLGPVAPVALPQTGRGPSPIGPVGLPAGPGRRIGRGPDGPTRREGVGGGGSRSGGTDRPAMIKEGGLRGRKDGPTRARLDLGDVVAASPWAASMPKYGVPKGDERYVMLCAFGKPNAYNANDYKFAFMIRNWFIASQ